MNIQKPYVKVLIVAFFVLIFAFLSVNLFFKQWGVWDYVQVASYTILTIMICVRLFKGGRESE